jgi:hypothetical protein
MTVATRSTSTLLRALAARVAPGISTSRQNQASRLRGITHSKACSVLAHAPHKIAHARAGRESATATYLLAAVEVLLPHTTHAHEPILRVFDAHEPDELAHVGFLEHVEPVLWQPLHQHHLGIELCRSCPRHTSWLRPCALCVLSVLSYAFCLHWVMPFVCTGLRPCALYGLAMRCALCVVSALGYAFGLPPCALSVASYTLCAMPSVCTGLRPCALCLVSALHALALCVLSALHAVHSCQTTWQQTSDANTPANASMAEASITGGGYYKSRKKSGGGGWGGG